MLMNLDILQSKVGLQVNLEGEPSEWRLVAGDY